MKNTKTLHTDATYFSKKELSENKNEMNSLVTWDEVHAYRKKYTFEIPVLFSNKINMYLTQTPWILQKEIGMITDFSEIQQKMLASISSKYSSYSLLEDIEHKSFVSDIHWLMNMNSKKNKVSRSIIDNIVAQNDTPSNPEERKIEKIYRNLVLISKTKTTPMVIAKIFFGKKKIEDPNLGDIHSSLVETVKTSKISSLLTKAASVVYAVKGNNMFGDKTYEVMILSLMSLLKNSYKGSILKGISFFETFSFFEESINEAITKTKSSKGDLTFLTQEMIIVLMYCIKESEKKIEEFIREQKRYNSLSTRDKNGNIKHILKTFPKIRRKQADFFTSHKDQTLSYTVKDFQEYIGSSYETGRYSLENLVKEGFYKKTKVGKKYVYKAIKQ